MDYYGLLFLYYLKGLSGKSVLRLFFNIEVGGTEQLLPENTSAPTTTPILADIQYPDGLRTDQYFTYRETPTTVSNKARIKTIKGNTLVWNQLVRRGDSDTTSKNGVTITTTVTADNSISLTAQGTVNLTTEDQNYYSLIQPINIKNGHKYLLSSTSSTFYLYGYGAGTTAIDQQKSIFTSTRDSLMGFTIRPITSAFTEGKAINETFYVMFIDLTQMFKSGNEPATVEEFASLFPLPYYGYNAGTLLSFNGTGIKTVGKNLWDEQYESGYYDIADGSKKNSSTWARCTNPIRVLPNTSYVFKSFGEYSGALGYFLFYDGGMNLLSSVQQAGSIATDSGQTITTPSNAMWMTFYMNANRFNNVNVFSFSAMDSYEPYTSSTLSLPISTYFPTGMKSAGSVYDELTPTKAITRIGAVNMGTLLWTHNANYEFFYATLTDGAIFTGVEDKDLLCPIYTTETTVNSTSLMSNVNDKTIRGRRGITSCQIYIKDTSYTSATDLVNALQGIPLYYELATPTETPITTEDANEALSLLMGKSVSSNNAKQMIDIITKGE